MKKKYCFFILAVLIASVAWNVYWNRTITVHTYTHTNENIPEKLNGFRIVQLTDLHSVRDEAQREKVYTSILEQKPDIICVTGDLVDSRYYAANGPEGEKLTLALMKKLVGLAPVYFVYGNHEMILLDDPQNNAFRVALLEMGVQIINNDVIRYTSEDSDDLIYIGGIQDPSTLYKDYRYAFLSNNGERMEAMLDAVTVGIRNEDFFVLLSHRPEYLEMYDQYPVDLCLTGHAHGGQFRLPFIGGVYAPGQGFFPKYTAGLYETDDLEMYVGTGVGNSAIPVRIFNPPEILTIILQKEKLHNRRRQRYSCAH